MNVVHSSRGITCMLALCCAAAQAQTDEARAPRLEVETLPQWDTAVRDSVAAQRLASQPASGDDGLRTRVWWGRGAIEVGAGADWRDATAAQPRSQVIGVRATLSPRTRVIYETETARPWRNAESGSATPRTARIALEFKSKKSPVSSLRDGLMRVQLSGDAAVHFKPRGGGLQVTYRERF